MRSLIYIALFAVVTASVGCGESEFRAQGGKVVVQHPADFAFSGDVLELRLESDPLQRAFAEIKPDGTFDIESIHEGAISAGLRPGVYRARLVFSDDDPEHTKRASKVIHRKFTRFETSGLRIQVPSQDAVLSVSGK